MDENGGLGSQELSSSYSGWKVMVMGDDHVMTFIF
jgi:hypothetical protein